MSEGKMKLENLVSLFEQTQSELQKRAARSVDIALVVRNWLFGWYIVEFEICGAERKDLYGKELIKRLSEELKKSGIKGMSQTNLKQFRLFYDNYKKIGQAVPDRSLDSKIDTSEITQALPAQSIFNEEIWQKISQAVPDLSQNTGKIQQALPVESELPEILQAMTAKLCDRFILGWTHYVTLLTVKNTEERRFYEIEAAENGWGYRELDRQINSSLYERLALSRDKDGVKELGTKGQIIEKADDVIKSPYILEFTGLETRDSYSEHELETALINKIEHFLLELGKGFLFESRQKRFSFDNRHFYVDLVFYNRLLRSYVIIDLKIGDLKHQDLGQMQMYVNYFDRYVKTDDEKPTVGILLCHTKSDDLVELTLPVDSNIYASEYELYLPSKEELRKQLEEAQQELGNNE